MSDEEQKVEANVVVDVKEQGQNSGDGGTRSEGGSYLHQQAQGSASDDIGKIFVGGLSWDTTEQG